MPQPPPEPQPHLRAADADRAAVAEVLGTHLSAGRLTVEEYDDRLGRAYAARTYGELAELTTDLPTTTPAVAPLPAPAATPVPASAGCGSGGGSASLRAAWASWLATAVIVIGIWGLTSLASGDLTYPWPIWVVGPWGVVLLARSLGGHGTHDARERRDPGVSGALSGGQGGS